MMIQSKIHIIIAPGLSFKKQEALEKELHLSVGGPSFIDLIPSICWLVRSNYDADGLHQFLEDILTEDEDFAIYELAEELDYVQSVREFAQQWTDVHF